MISILCYVVLYYNINSIFQNIYLPYVSQFNATNNYETIDSYPELYFLLKNTSYFMLFIYGYDLITRKIYSPRYDKNSIGLMLVYIKHILNIIITQKLN